MATIRETPATVENDFRLLGGVAVIYLGVSTWGHHDTEELLVGEGNAEVIAEHEFVVVAAGILSGLKTGAAITVDGEARQIRNFRPRSGSGGTEIQIDLRERDPSNRAHRRS